MKRYAILGRSIARTGAAMLLAVVSLSAAGAPHTFRGVITDSMCDHGDHAHMRMGETDAECALACVEAHDGVFVLADGEQHYELSDQKAAKALAGRLVKVVGTLDTAGKTIAVESISPSS